jgi:hypothetical protein
MTELTLTPFEHIVSTEFQGGEGVLVDLNTKRYYQLNETAMLVWRGLANVTPLDHMVTEMTRLYTVTPEHAAASIERVMKEFQSLKLLQSV